MTIEEAKEFVLNAVITPALNSAAVSPKTKDSIKKTKQWIEHCKYVGDIYAYISRFSGEEGSRYGGVYSELKTNNLTPIEDIIEPFKTRFKDKLDEVLDLSTFNVGDTYSSWDISIIARVFNVQRGIYVLEEKGQLECILSKVTIGGNSDYPNSWIEYGKVLKHSMLTFKGNTDINFESNKAIIQSSGKPIHIFLKEDTDCVYDGIYDYVDWLEGNDGGKWFVLKKRDQERLQNFNEYVEKLEQNIKRAKSLPKSRREDLIKNASPIPAKKLALVEVYERNPNVIAEALIRANGVCESCNQPAPFKRAKDGTPYLEVHHKLPLARGGEDSIENALAVCPNCHRKAHFG